MHKHIQTNDQVFTLSNPHTEAISLLGKGGQGKVVLARTFDGKKVAVKIEKETQAHLQDNRLQRLLALKKDDLERKILAHEHLLIGHFTVYPQKTKPFSNVVRKHYTVMEYVEGQELSLINPKTLSEKQKLTIAKLLCQGLAHIHKGRFIHGDIKPANVKVYINEDNIRVQFIDFGISLELNEGATQIDDLPCAFGSDDYIAPEVSKGYSIGYASDIYSLGVLFRLALHLNQFNDMTSHRIERRPSLDQVIERIDDALALLNRASIQRRL